jgi:hypothetical protein
MSIQDISDGKGEAFVAILHDYNNAKVMGKDMSELTAGIKTTIDYLKDKDVQKKNGIIAGNLA